MYKTAFFSLLLFCFTFYIILFCNQTCTLVLTLTFITKYCLSLTVIILSLMAFIHGNLLIPCAIIITGTLLLSVTLHFK